jgi:hypothetical protein
LRSRIAAQQWFAGISPGEKTRLRPPDCQPQQPWAFFGQRAKSATIIPKVTPLFLLTTYYAVSPHNRWLMSRKKFALHWALLIAVGNLAISSGTVCAWEADVHYGLTRWLAIEAGFSEQDAGQIARGNLAIDTSPVTNPLIVGTFGCLRDDQQASISLHDNHFPSEVYPGNLPRQAKRGRPAAEKIPDGAGTQWVRPFGTLDLWSYDCNAGAHPSRALCKMPRAGGT